MAEKRLRKVTFEFEDGTTLQLSGDDLGTWEGICGGYSDYLLPGGPDHVLGEGYGGLVRGFIPRAVVEGIRWRATRRVDD